MNGKGYNPYNHVPKAGNRQLLVKVKLLADIMRDSRLRAAAQLERARRLDRMVPVIMAGLLARSGTVAHDCGEWRAAAEMALRIARQMTDVIDRTTV